MKGYSPEVRERAVRLVFEHEAEGGDRLDRGEDRLHGGDAAGLGRQADPGRLPPRVKRNHFRMPGSRLVYEASFGVCGARKVWRPLGRESFKVARCSAERLMRSLGLSGWCVGADAAQRSLTRALRSRSIG